MGDKILSPDRAALVVCIIKGFEIYVAIIARDIRDRVLNINTNLAFLCLLMQICLDKGVFVLPNVNYFGKSIGKLI